MLAIVLTSEAPLLRWFNCAWQSALECYICPRLVTWLVMSMMGCQCHRCAGSEIARVAGSESVVSAGPCLWHTGAAYSWGQSGARAAAPRHKSEMLWGRKGGTGDRGQEKGGGRRLLQGVWVLISQWHRHSPVASVLFPDQKATPLLSPHLYCLSVSELICWETGWGQPPPGAALSS